jgi:hypothetical protein
MRLGSVILRASAVLTLGMAATAQTPDVIVYDIGVNGGNTNDIAYYGQNGGIAAYSIATQSCNKGTAQLDWYDAGGDTRHPVIGQNMFRFKDDRFEQIGQSWLKHGFCAVNETEAFCGPCQSTSCDTLGIGCADTYWATLNDGASGRSKRFVNASDGTHTDGTPGPTGNTTIRGRLQVAVADIDPAQNPGAEWFIEGQYITADDHQAGNAGNNCSYRRVNVAAVNNVTGGGATNREIPAIYAWQGEDAGVEIKSFNVTETGGFKTRYVLGYRVTSIGPDQWHYEYALQNISSDQSVGSFTVQASVSSGISNIGFHDVAYHSGDPFDGTDWPGGLGGGGVTWATTPYATNPNANALRWGTMYNFRFDAQTPPQLGTVTIGMFKPGLSNSATVSDVLVPSSLPFSKAVTSAAPTGTGEVVAPLVADDNGSGHNPDVFTQLRPAIPGRQWEGYVSLSRLERAVLLVGRLADTPTLTGMGELLLAQPLSTRIESGLSFEVPQDPALIGTTFAAQAAVQRDGTWQLTNALVVTVGSAD